ncbi:MAG: hypothetical protein KDA27_05950 [Candidatus Eisenbacteria bacterium]|uniref:Uncharacterized protein n=1 Tax=Eiseniibacteriota bacterium TaxID=2212470 RepID=A0A956NA04_UNCEI|nr:hypothetical protein [Candidatus Eisenbacteria bacterium]MCB9466122.1 hypothetical protein [Candidatus Eisenbacteria bacterium]
MRTPRRTIMLAATALAATALASSFLAFPALAAAEEPRTLDEISIEGEVAMPQVLFITAREPYRFPDIAHRGYLVSADDVRSLVTFPIPLWIGRTLAPSVSILDWDDSASPIGEEPASSPRSSDEPQGRN